MRNLLKHFLGEVPEAGPEASGCARLNLTDPPGLICAVGDVHGCVNELKALEARLAGTAAEAPEALLVMLGDYVDRGADTFAVIDHLIGPAPFGFDRICLCGNHEQMLIDAYDTGENIEGWLGMGGSETLVSYGAGHFELRQAAGNPRRLQQIMHSHIPVEHMSFLRRLPSIVLADKFAFVHAGVRPGTNLAKQSDTDLMWARTDYKRTPHRLGLCVVHGHTPTEIPISNDQHINVDTGAYMSGRLTAAIIRNGAMEGFVTTGT